jgi:hypothetical protein
MLIGEEKTEDFAEFNVLFFVNAILRTVKVTLTLKQAVMAQAVGRGDYINSSTYCVTSALDEVGGQRHSLVALPPGMTPYP